jgi:hypothetical protein
MHSPAKQAHLDQLTTEAQHMLRQMVAATRQQRAEVGRERTTANVALALSLPPFASSEMRRSLLMVAIDMLADYLPEEGDDLP